MTPYYERGGIAIYHGDCLDLLPRLRGLSGGVVITDPPYNAGIKYGPGTNDRQDWRAWVRWLDVRLRRCDRVAPETLMFLSQTAYRRYVRHSRREIAWSAVWMKPLSMAVCAAPFMPHWEHMVYFGERKKGQRRLPDGRFVRHADGGFGSDVFVANVEVGTERYGHPTPKPMKLMREVVGRVTTDAAFILDPFCGSGTTLRAAQEAGRRAIGIEIEERWCEATAKRLDDFVPGPREQLQMFAGVQL